MEEIKTKNILIMTDQNVSSLAELVQLDHQYLVYRDRTDDSLEQDNSQSLSPLLGDCKEKSKKDSREEEYIRFKYPSKRNSEKNEDDEQDGTNKHLLSNGSTGIPEKEHMDFVKNYLGCSTSSCSVTIGSDTKEDYKKENVAHEKITSISINFPAFNVRCGFPRNNLNVFQSAICGNSQVKSCSLIPNAAMIQKHFQSMLTLTSFKSLADNTSADELGRNENQNSNKRTERKSTEKEYRPTPENGNSNLNSCNEKTTYNQEVILVNTERQNESSSEESEEAESQLTTNVDKNEGEKSDVSEMNSQLLEVKPQKMVTKTTKDILVNHISKMSKTGSASKILNNKLEPQTQKEKKQKSISTSKSFSISSETKRKPLKGSPRCTQSIHGCVTDEEYRKVKNEIETGIREDAILSYAYSLLLERWGEYLALSADKLHDFALQEAREGSCDEVIDMLEDRERYVWQLVDELLSSTDAI